MSSRHSNVVEGCLDAQIVDLRLFDFALSKRRAKIEITYIEVNIPGNSKLDDRSPNHRTKEGERVVLRPEQVKKAQLRLRLPFIGYSYEDVVINLEELRSNSGSFPLAQTWAERNL